MQLLSGFVGTAGGVAGLVFFIVGVVLNYRDTESDRNVLGGGLFLR